MSSSLTRLKDLAVDLVQQLNETSTVLDQRHFRLLINLSGNEKQALANSVLEWSWNVGSPIVMKFLQKSHIICMTDLIVYTFNQNTDAAQLILNDLLETEFILLADIMKSANPSEPTGLMVCDLLNEGFKRLCNDIIDNPSLLVKNYLDEVDEYVPDECMEEIRMMHLKLLLQDGPKYSASDAIINQCTWNDDITNQPNVMFKSFFTSIVGGDFDRRQKTFQDILNKCDDWESHNWKNVLLLLRMAVNAIDSTHFNIDECNTFKAMAKTFLKDTMRSSIDEEDETGLYVLFLVARQITKYNESLFGNYANWFKNTIGEMKYTLKANEFTITMQSLAGMVQLESNIDYLDVHIKTYIPAPTRCNQLVNNYKQLCESRKLYLKSPIEIGANQSTVMEEDVFIIDDD